MRSDWGKRYPHFAQCLAKSKNPVNVTCYVNLPFRGILLHQSSGAKKPPVLGCLSSFSSMEKINIFVCSVCARQELGTVFPPLPLLTFVTFPDAIPYVHWLGIDRSVLNAEMNASQ